MENEKISNIHNKSMQTTAVTKTHSTITTTTIRKIYEVEKKFLIDRNEVIVNQIWLNDAVHHRKVECGMCSEQLNL